MNAFFRAIAVMIDIGFSLISICAGLWLMNAPTFITKPPALEELFYPEQLNGYLHEYGRNHTFESDTDNLINTKSEYCVQNDLVEKIASENFFILGGFLVVESVVSIIGLTPIYKKYRNHYICRLFGKFFLDFCFPAIGFLIVDWFVEMLKLSFLHPTDGIREQCQ